MLQKMHRASNITLADAAAVTKDAAGNVQIKETQEVSAGKGAKRGTPVLHTADSRPHAAILQSPRAGWLPDYTGLMPPGWCGRGRAPRGG